MDEPIIFLGRTPLDECTGVELMCEQYDAFPSERVIARQDATFEVVIGPSANPRGYTAITGELSAMIFIDGYAAFYNRCQTVIGSKTHNCSYYIIKYEIFETPRY